MNLYDILIAKERERKERIKDLLVRAYKTAKLDYEQATVYIPREGLTKGKIPPREPGDTVLMLEGKAINKEWYNRVIVSYLSKLAQKSIEKGDIPVY